MVESSLWLSEVVTKEGAGCADRFFAPGCSGHKFDSIVPRSNGEPDEWVSKGWKVRIGDC